MQLRDIKQKSWFYEGIIKINCFQSYGKTEKGAKKNFKTAILLEISKKIK